MIEEWGSGSKVEQHWNIMVANAIASNFAKEIKSSLIAVTDKVYSNGGSRKDEHSDGMPKSADIFCISERPTCYEGR